MLTEETNETMKLVAELMRERGVIAFAVVAVEPDDDTRFSVRASAASLLDEETPEAQAVMSKMMDGLRTVMGEMMNGGGRKEYLN